MTCMDWNEEKERRMWFDEHFIGFKHFNWYLVVKFSQRCFRYRALNFGFALDIESLSYMYKNSTEISRDRRRQSQKEVVSFEISITMFPAALYISTFVTCVGRILRGWLGAGQEVEHILSLIKVCPRLRIKYVILQSLSLITFFL